MRLASVITVLAVTLTGAAGMAAADPASGTVKSPTGTISPKFATAYIVRDPRSPRQTVVEVLLSETAVDATSLRDQLDRHVAAINLPALNDHNYLLLWITPDGSVRMNATYSKTMTQYLNDTTGGLKGEFTTNTPSKIDGRVYSPAPLKTMDGPTYTIDVKFTADVMPAQTGTALPAGGGDPGRALTAFLNAITQKNWNGIKAGLSPNLLPHYDHSDEPQADNLSSAVSIFSARLTLTKAKVAGGMQTSPTVAVLELEGERFGTPWLSIVKMVKTGAVWQYDDSAPVGMLR